MKVRSAFLAITAVFLSGCAASRKTGVPPEPVTATRSSPAVSTRSPGPWTITPTSAEQRYRSTTSTLLELADSAAITTDSIKSTVDFTLSINRNHKMLSYSARIESISIEGGQRTASVPESIRLPFSYTGHLQQGKLTVDLESHSPVTDCSNEALSAMAIVQRTVVPTPLFLQKDMTWTDSTSASTCSGSIPVSSITSRHYKVIGTMDNGILIEQQNKTFSTGEGIQGQHRVRLHSEATGTIQLVINPQTGTLVESSGTHITSVVVTASGRDRKFTQITRERISQR